MLLIDLRLTSPWPGRRYVFAQGHEIDTVQDHELYARHATDRAWQAADDPAVSVAAQADLGLVLFADLARRPPGAPVNA